MAELELRVVVTGALSTNCYIIFNKQTRACFLVDCPEPVDPIKVFLQSHDLEVSFIALTHAHFDHIGGLDSFNVPIYVHQEDSDFLATPHLNGSVLFGAPVTIKAAATIYEPEKLMFGPHTIDIIHTPGHTPGSVCLRLDTWLLSGDTLFYRSVGRTDVPRGSQQAIQESIREKLLILPDDVIVYPGHGPQTTIGAEKQENPFIS